MCNSEVLDTLRELVEKLISHTGELRNRFNDVEEEYQEGNLDIKTLRDLNQAVHLMETNAAAFEKLLEA